MKRLFTKTFAVFFIFTVLVSGLNIHAKEKPLYEKYEYQENFEYEDEIIGHALKAAVPKILLEYSAQMRYKPVRLDVDAMDIQVEEWYNELSSYYSDEELSEALIALIVENLYSYISYGAYKEEYIEGSGHGSGVVISDNGYIATNAHVATLDEESKLNLYMSSLSQSVVEDLDVILNDLYDYGIQLSEEDIYYLHEMIFYLASENAQIKGEETVLKVCFASPDSNTDMENATIYEAELVEIGTQEGVDGLTQDTAILKIDAKNLIALPLSDSYPESNSHIVSAGYPGVSEEMFSSSEQEAPTVSVSIVKGTVTRLVDTVNKDYKAIAIDSTISGGNSGGPSVDTHLQIEGLNTYVSILDNRFAGMVPAAYVKALTEDFNIELGEATKTFLTGLQLLQQDYGPAAQECFEYVKSLQKDTPYIEHLITLAEKAPKNEHPADEEPVKAGGEENFFEMIINNPVYLAISIVIIVLILLIIIISIILICTRSKKKKKKTVTKDFSRSYVPTASTLAPTSTMVDDTLVQENSSQQNYTPHQGNSSQMSSVPQQDNYSQQDYTPQSTIRPGDYTFPSPNYVSEQPTAYSPVPDSTPPSKPRLKSTMKKAAPEEPKEPKETDENFHSPSDL